MWSYRKRLERDLARWRSNGWLSAEGEARIRADVASRATGVGLAAALGIVASVLLALAALSFVAAHWDDLPRLARLGMLIAGIWAAYGTAGILRSRSGDAFADAAILLGTALYGASIMLVSQMYHIYGHAPDALLAWWLGALLAGVALRSNAVLALAMVLVCVWAGMETSESNRVFWPFLIGWALVSAAFWWMRWRPGLHLSALALSLFVVHLGYWLASAQHHELVVALGLAGVAASVASTRFAPDLGDWPSTALGYAVGVTYAGLFALQFIDSTSQGQFVVLAAASLAFVIGAIAYGWQAQHKGALWLGYIAFSVEVLGIYQKTVGSILDTSLFFLVAGVLVAILAYFAYRLAKREAGEGANA